MISKKKLRVRLLDICAGAGMYWKEEYDYFDYSESYGKSLGYLIAGINNSIFKGTDMSRLVSPHNLERYETIDYLVGLVMETLELDCE